MRSVVLVLPKTKQLPLLDADIIGVDGGVAYLLDHNIEMMLAVGDFDSLPHRYHEQLEQLTCQRLQHEKNETDTQVALSYALEQGYDEIIIYGGLGGRIDHELANLSLLVHHDANIVLMNETNRIQKLMPGVHQVKPLMKYLSLLPLVESVVSLEGVKYPLQQQTIHVDDIYTISNEILTTATITVVSGSFLLIQSKDEPK
ncbi:MAG: thiamine diphosphokinase [Erysipelotrichaceae bacterium]